jgi:subtilisin family serine protease
MKRAAAIPALIAAFLVACGAVWAAEPVPAKYLIVPGIGIGDFKLDMTKDEVLKKLGKPDAIQIIGEDEVVHPADEKYNLNSIPSSCILTFGDILFWIGDDSVVAISACSPRYKLNDGLAVGDSEQKVKQAFGEGFSITRLGRNLLAYRGRGIAFTIQKNRTVAEISVFEADVNKRDDRKLKAYEEVDDLRDQDLRNAADILDTLSFDQETLWPPPERLPEGFDPQALLEEGMNPGLGVRALHAQGITGAGVHVGLIDQPLLLDHPEYAGKIVSYHAAGFEPGQSSMHGPAMASLLVGDRCGTAPGAKLHVVAARSFEGDAGNEARALDRLVAYNKDAPEAQKIRVVSVSAQPSGEGSTRTNQHLWDKAVKRAQTQGILVLDCTWHHGFVSVCWLDPKDRENVEACTPGFRNDTVEFDQGHIHVPTIPRTWAVTKPSGYAYSGGGRRSRRARAKNGYSSAIPYAAGVLAMGWQIRPDLAPEQMKELLFASAHVHKSGAKIINPTAFIDLIRKQGGNRTLTLRTYPKTSPGTQIIVPGVGIGDFKIGMSKDDVLKRLGTPKLIYLGGERYTLNNLPTRYRMYFGAISVEINYNKVREITVHAASYKLANGLRVGEAEETIKRTFGKDYSLNKGNLIYAEKGLRFSIDQDSKRVSDIRITRARRKQSKQTIVPGVGIGALKLGMSKDDVLKKLGMPQVIHGSGRAYTLENLPTTSYEMCYDSLTLEINDNAVQMIRTSSRTHKFANGLGVGDSEDDIKRAFGKDPKRGEDFLSYANRGVTFYMDEENRTVAINVSPALTPYYPLPGSLVFPKIDRRPRMMTLDRRELKEVPKYDHDEDNPYQIDLRCRDLSKLDLTDSVDDLLYANFDDRTVWPASDKMPPDFDRHKIMEFGKNPGLGIRSLHKKGITGRGVSIAIIDQPLLVDHQEYADRLKLYEEVHVPHGYPVTMHGAALATIAVGKTAGVAPDADLFFLAADFSDAAYVADGIRRIMEINEQLPRDKKIRAIAMAKSFVRRQKGYGSITKAIRKAQAAGILVVCINVGLAHDGCDLAFLGRSPLADPDVFESFEPALHTAKGFWAVDRFRADRRFFVPIGSRTTASPHGIDQYVFYCPGGGSWAPPYVAGVYALVVQVDPAITPERFWALAAKTGRIIELERNGKRRRLGPIIEPVRLIRSIQTALER